MTMTINDIPTTELLTDYADAWNDLGWCRLALALEIETYGDGESVKDRIAVNQMVIQVTAAELERRGIDPSGIEIVPAVAGEVDKWNTQNATDAE